MLFCPTHRRAKKPISKKIKIAPLFNDVNVWPARVPWVTPETCEEVTVPRVGCLVWLQWIRRTMLKDGACLMKPALVLSQPRPPWLACGGVFYVFSSWHAAPPACARRRGNERWTILPQQSSGKSTSCAMPCTGCQVVFTHQIAARESVHCVQHRRYGTLPPQYSVTYSLCCIMTPHPLAIQALSRRGCGKTHCPTRTVRSKQTAGFDEFSMSNKRSAFALAAHPPNIKYTCGSTTT